MALLGDPLNEAFTILGNAIVQTRLGDKWTIVNIDSCEPSGSMSPDLDDVTTISLVVEHIERDKCDEANVRDKGLTVRRARTQAQQLNDTETPLGQPAL